MTKKIDKKIEEIVENPCMCEESHNNCTFTVDDRIFLKRGFEELHDWLKEANTENQRYIAEIIVAANNMLFNKLDDINANIKTIREQISLIQLRIESIEKKMESFDNELMTTNKKLLNTCNEVKSMRTELEQLKLDIAAIKTKINLQ
jgi:chromosome segregation ATPase